MIVGIGDDCAVLAPPAGTQLVVSTDTLNVGVHFPEGTDAQAVGHKALAVNLSDLAAAGATPAWFTLNLSLPQVDTAWLEAFCRGLFTLAGRYEMQLIGGDTTRGPLSVTMTAFGFAPSAAALLRSGAKPQDAVYLTGALGAAAVGLLALQAKLTLPDTLRAAALERLHRPQPRVQEGLALRGIASACIDVSDGLVADLGHILEASGVGATLHLKDIPLSEPYHYCFDRLGWDPAIAHGDDYELCFTAPPGRESAALAAGGRRIGVIEAQPGLRLLDPGGRPYRPAHSGFDHFAPP